MPPHAFLRRSLLLAVLLAGAASAPHLAGQAQAPPTPADVVSAVKARFAPDARIAVFDVKAEAKESSIELTGDVEQPSAKEALVAALHDAGFAGVVDKVAV